MQYLCKIICFGCRVFVVSNVQMAQQQNNRDYTVAMYHILNVSIIFFSSEADYQIVNPSAFIVFFFFHFLHFFPRSIVYWVFADCDGILNKTM